MDTRQQALRRYRHLRKVTSRHLDGALKHLPGAASLPVGSKNSNLLNDPDFTTEMLADQRAARPV